MCFQTLSKFFPDFSIGGSTGQERSPPCTFSVLSWNKTVPSLTSTFLQGLCSYYKINHRNTAKQQQKTLSGLKGKFLFEMAFPNECLDFLPSVKVIFSIRNRLGIARDSRAYSGTQITWKFSSLLTLSDWKQQGNGQQCHKLLNR